MGAQPPKRPDPGHAMLMARVGDDATQRALDAVKQTMQQVQASAAALEVTVAGAPGRLLARQELTGAATYVPTSGATRARVQMCAAGGGGGGAAGGAGVAIGGGGASGTTIETLVGAEGVPLTGGAYSVPGSAAGGGGAGTNGAAGGDATLRIAGQDLVAKGGGGGGGMASSAVNAQAVGGGAVAGSTPTARIHQDAGDSSQLIVLPTNLAFGGAGGDSLLGAGGGARSGFGAGISAQGPGGGGGGAIAAGAGTSGGAGGAGLIIIEEYS